MIIWYMLMLPKAKVLELAGFEAVSESEECTHEQ